LNNFQSIKILLWSRNISVLLHSFIKNTLLLSKSVDRIDNSKILGYRCIKGADEMSMSVTTTRRRPTQIFVKDGIPINQEQAELAKNSDFKGKMSNAVFV
jgi:hypothetical protein